MWRESGRVRVSVCPRGRWHVRCDVSTRLLQLLIAAPTRRGTNEGDGGRRTADGGRQTCEEEMISYCR